MPSTTASLPARMICRACAGEYAMRYQPVLFDDTVVHAIDGALEVLGRLDLLVDRVHVVAREVAAALAGAAQRLVRDHVLRDQADAAQIRALEPLVIHLLMRRACRGRPAVECAGAVDLVLSFGNALLSGWVSACSAFGPWIS